MDFRGDRRAQSVQVGAVLLLGILVLAMSIYQVQVVPADNRAVEFEHNANAQEQLGELRNSILRSAATGSVQPTSVRTAPRYPTRTLFVNPGPRAGSLRTLGADDPSATITIENAAAAGDAETRDYWNGTERTFETSTLVYRPDYAEYRNPPTTVYEHSVLYNRFDNGNEIARTDQRLVRGDRISLVALDGTLSESGGGSTSVDSEALSASTNRVKIEPADAGEPIRITVPTQLSESKWRELLPTDDENVEISYAERPDEPFDLLTIELRGDSYELRLAKVGIGRDAEDERAAYITDVRQEGTTVVAEVRDRFNNPVGADARVDVYVNGEWRTRLDTDAEGRVRYSGGEYGDAVELTIGGEAPDSAESSKVVRFDLGSGSANDGTTEINPSDEDRGAVRLRGAERTSKQSVSLTFENTGDATRTIREVRVPFYYPTTNSKIADRGRIRGVDPAVTAYTDFAVRGNFVRLEEEIDVPAGDTRVVEVEFTEPNNLQVGGDFFIVSMEYEDGERSSYFVAVP